MDPLSITASIAAILQLASSVVSYLTAVKDASDDRRRLIAELGSITGLLYLLRDSANNPITALRSLSTPDGPLKQLTDSLNELALKLRPASTGLSKAGKSFLWPFQNNEIKSILARIERFKTLFCLALQNDNNQLNHQMAIDLEGMRASLGYVHDTIKEMGHSAAEQERERILYWISPLSFRAKHQSVLSNHHSGTGDWFFSTPEFESWRNGTSKAIWCTGIPGAGKTILASLVIDKLEHELAYSRGELLAYVYCSYQEPDHISINLLANILRQIVQRQPTLSQRIRELYGTHLVKGSRLSLDEISTEMQALSQNFKDLYLVVDALDECKVDGGTRVTFLEVVQKITNDVHLLVTSRPTVNVHGCLPTAVCISVDAKDDDIEKYLKDRMGHESRLRRVIAGDRDLEDTIVNTILKNAKGMFLLARLHLDSLAKKHTRRDIRLALRGLPREIYDTYNEVLGRILRQDEEDVVLARLVLLWVLHSRRPLTIQELKHALAVSPGAIDTDNDALIDEEIFVSVCLGMVTIEPQRRTLGFIHHTVQEFFQKYPIETPLRAQELIVKTCLTYLAFDVFATGYCGNPRSLSARLERYPFFEYAAQWWGVHLRTISNNEVLMHAVEFLKDGGRVTAAGEIIYTLYTRPGMLYDRPRMFTGMHLAARFGVCSIVQILLEKTTMDINHQDEYGQTALAVAARWGHTSLIEYLLSLSLSIVDVNAGVWSTCGTALHAASWAGHQTFVEKIINAGANVSATDARGRTPLHLASENGGVTMIKFLLSKGADPRAVTDTGTTPLYRAARNGSIEAVQALIDAGGQINTVTWDTWTPLHEAVEMDHPHMVAYLLSKGADRTIRTRDGQTPLEMAVFLGRERVRKILEAAQGEAIEAESSMLPIRSRKRDAALPITEQDADVHKRQHVK